MYQLTLTHGERRAIDFVDSRYANGIDLYKLLWGKCESQPVCDWDDNLPITFYVKEYIAWQIKELAEQDNYQWPLFSPEFAAKMQTFVDSIV